MSKSSLVVAVLAVTLACTVPEPPDPPTPPPIPEFSVVLEDPGREPLASLMGPVSSPAGAAEEEIQGAYVRAELRRDGLGVEVRVENRNPQTIQLLLQEWSLTDGEETSPVVTGDVSNAQAQGACIGPVTLPGGGVYSTVLVMRKRHGFYGGRYALEPMRGDVVLACVVSAENGRNLGALRLRR